MAYALLFTLLQQHETAAEYYRRGAALAQDEGLKKILARLAEYREAFGKEIREFLEDSPPIPIPNQDPEASIPVIKKRWLHLEDALKAGNRVEMLDVCHETENRLSELYQLSLGNEESIAEGIRDLFQRHHRRVIEIIGMMDYLEKVPMQREDEFDF